jgi:pimeloyl-ACP methyl ester carboxylesterase
MEANAMPGWQTIFLLLLFIILLLNIVPYCLPVTRVGADARPPFPESRLIDTGAVRIHCRAWIPAEIASGSQSIVFVHGMAGSTFSWRNQVQTLREAGHVVLAVDLPGFGYSDRRRGLVHSQAERAQILWKVIDAICAQLAIGNPAAWHLAGHSMGGGTITAMAEQQPHRVASLIYLDAAVSEIRYPKRLFAYPPAARYLEVVIRHVLLKPSRFRSFLHSAYGRDAIREEVSGYLSPLLIPGTERCLVDMIRTSTATTKAELAAIDRAFYPVMAIWGENDSWIPKTDAYALQSIIKRMRLSIIPGACHCPMETEFERVNALLLDWLS